MFLEEILKEIATQNKKLLEKLHDIEKTIESKFGENLEYLTLKQLSNSGRWPYSEMATRKMIERGKFAEGYHYRKVNGRILVYWPAMNEYLEKKFFSKNLKGVA